MDDYRDRPYLDVYLLVTSQGEVWWDCKVSRRQYLTASFIVGREDDSLVVWKDRYGIHGRNVSAAWTGIRAAQHLTWLGMSLFDAEGRELDEARDFLRRMIDDGYPAE